MRSWTDRLCALALAAVLTLALLPVAASAAAAENITKNTTLTGSGFSSLGFLTDGNTANYVTSNGNVELTLSNPAGIGGLYLMFDREYGEYTVCNNDSGASVTAGKYRMLHEFVDLDAAFGTAPTSVTLKFESGKVRLSEIYALSAGEELPDFVQVWNAPLEGKADIVLFATHGDDDQLFFAGMMPLYAAERGCALQVVYLTDHRNLTSGRIHEMINGLWNVGVRAYPVFGDFQDFRIDSKQGTYDEYARLGRSKEELQGFVVEQIRRFRPQVAVGHDLNGEYGHGMHMVYADLLVNALELTGNAEKFPASAGKYGVWDVPKTYLHLYAENPIELDLDQPLESFNGMTAFQVTQKLGYPCHVSQQWTWFTEWIKGKDGSITKATQIATYSPCKYGLYRSLVGADTGKNDFMENIVTYAEQERLEQERLEQERLEQERLEQERLEQERLEQERLEQERLEQERLEQERLEQERLERERLEQEQARLKGLRNTLLVLGGLVLALAAVLVIARVQNIRRHKRRAASRRKKV